MPGQINGFPIVLKAHFNYQDFGWAEDYYMYGAAGADLTAAATAGKDLLQRRVFWLGTGAVLDYAAVSLVNSDQDSLMLDMYGYQGFPSTSAFKTLPSVGFMNDRCTGLEFRVSTLAAAVPGGTPLPRSFGTRILRGVPDTWIINVSMVLDPTQDVPITAPALGAGLPAIPYATTRDANGNFNVNVPNPALNLFTFRSSFLTALLKYCGLLVKRGSSHPAPYTDVERGNWRVNQYKRLVYRQVSDRRTGGPFGSVRGRAKKSY